MAELGTGAPNSTSAEGLEFFDLSHELVHGMPEWPAISGFDLHINQSHANDGIYTQEFDGVMHRGTHMDAPVHVLADMPYITEYPMWRFFGTGVAVSIPKGKWGVVTAEDLEAATPRIEPGDIVMINTGFHRIWGDNPDYFAYGGGNYKEAAEWLVEREVKLVGVDVQANDHPLGTKLVSHGMGPSQPHLENEYREETGREVLDDFPYWEPAHKILMPNGIPGIENVGGELDKVTGKRCTFAIFPWRWVHGEGCSVRVVAIVDPSDGFRLETGEEDA
jgi:kynurenine formamidase